MTAILSHAEPFVPALVPAWAPSTHQPREPHSTPFKHSPGPSGASTPDLPGKMRWTGHCGGIPQGVCMGDGPLWGCSPSFPTASGPWLCAPPPQGTWPGPCPPLLPTRPAPHFSPMRKLPGHLPLTLEQTYHSLILWGLRSHWHLGKRRACLAMCPLDPSHPHLPAAKQARPRAAAKGGPVWGRQPWAAGPTPTPPHPCQVDFLL